MPNITRRQTKEQFYEKEVFFVIGDELSFREQALEHLRCGVWHTRFSDDMDFRKFQVKKKSLSLVEHNDPHIKAALEWGAG